PDQSVGPKTASVRAADEDEAGPVFRMPEGMASDLHGLPLDLDDLTATDGLARGRNFGGRDSAEPVFRFVARLGFGHRSREPRAFAEQVLIEPGHQQRGGPVIDLPEAEHDRARPLDEERLDEPEVALAAGVLAQPALAGGEYDEVGIEFPGVDDLLRGD